MVRKVEEKFGGTYHADSSREALEEIMEQHNLIDIPPSNEKYTWSKKRVGKNNIKERLDIILVQETIAADYTFVKPKIIHTTTSIINQQHLFWAKWTTKVLFLLDTIQYGTAMKISELKSKRDGHKTIQYLPNIYGKQN